MDKRTYRLSWRSNKGGAHYQYAVFAVPAPIAKALWEKDIQNFTCELTDEGILYRPVIGDEPPGQIETPDWLK